MSETFTLYKLIVLYMLNKLDFPLTNGQISEFILEKGYTTYFTLQQAIAEMVEVGFVREESTHNRTLYHLTDEGKETIHFFSNNISSAIREDIDTYMADKNYQLKNEVSMKADYYRVNSREFAVRCRILENETPLIDLTVTLPSEEEAVRVVNNWSNKSQEVYAAVMQTLL